MAYTPGLNFPFGMKPVPSTLLNQLVANIEYLKSLIDTRLKNGQYMALDWTTPRLVGYSDAEVTFSNTSLQAKKSVSFSVSGGEARLKIAFDLRSANNGAETTTVQVRVNGVTIATYTSQTTDYESRTIIYDAKALIGTNATVELWAVVDGNWGRVKNFRVWAPELLPLA